MIRGETDAAGRTGEEGETEREEVAEEPAEGGSEEVSATDGCGS